MATAVAANVGKSVSGVGEGVAVMTTPLPATQNGVSVAKISSSSELSTSMGASFTANTNARKTVRLTPTSNRNATASPSDKRIERLCILLSCLARVARVCRLS
jgi:hypothetical protein